MPLPEPPDPNRSPLATAFATLLLLASVAIAINGSPLPSLAAAVIVGVLAAPHHRS